MSASQGPRYNAEGVPYAPCHRYAPALTYGPWAFVCADGAGRTCIIRWRTPGPLDFSVTLDGDGDGNGPSLGTFPTLGDALTHLAQLTE